MVPTRTVLPQALRAPDLAPPPGEVIVWHDGSTIWSAGPKTTERVAEADAVRGLWVAPSGQRLAYLVDGASGWEMWVADLPLVGVGQPSKVLAQAALSPVAPVAPAAPADAHVEPWHIAWAPDGARLPINRQLDVNDAGQLINRHRSVVSVVDVSAALAGDVNATELFVAAPFSSESDWAVYHGLQWDPSGRAVHLVVGPMVDKDRVAYLDGPGDLVGVGLDGVVATVAQAGEDSVQGVKFPIGAWSADGSRLAWLARRLAPRTPAVVPHPPPVPGTTAASSAWPSRALIIADSDGTGAQALDDVPYARLLWAPNGSALAYRPARPGADDQLRSEERRLVRPGQAPVLGELAR